MVFTVIRDEISRNSVSRLLVEKDPRSSSILIFHQTTSKEMIENLDRLGESTSAPSPGPTGEPGGLLSEGVAVSDHCLPKGAVIVSSQGACRLPEKATVPARKPRATNIPDRFW